MDNLELYNKLSRPPAEALKTIAAGRLKGKSDINPQWRYKAMTEAFGPCGSGWRYTIDRQWTEKGAGDEVMAFVNVSVYVRTAEGWSEAIPGTGGSMLVAKEKNGPYNSDEAFKMATTDALSVALKFLGVAAAIYAGEWDGTKYIGAGADDTLMQWEGYISSAASMEELQKNFGEAWTAYKGNAQAQAALTKAKDERKKALANGSA